MKVNIKTSKGLEDFLAYLRDTAEKCRMAEADRVFTDAATQDILHALELGQDKAGDRARLALKLREVRRKRRTAKDTAEQTEPIAAWVKQNPQTVKALERLLGEVRRVERKEQSRTYIPRTSVLEPVEKEEQSGD